MASSTSKYARAFGQPPCKYGNACYQQSRSHWEAFDHPATHSRFQGLASMSAPADDGESRKRKEPPASEPDDAAPLAAAPSVEMAASALVHTSMPLPVPFTAPPSVPPAAAPATATPSSLGRSLRGVPVPAGWGVHGGSLLVWRHMSPVASPKVGAFDFDGCAPRTHARARAHHGPHRRTLTRSGCDVLLTPLSRCLARTPLGGNDPNAWSMQFTHVPAVLASLAASGHTLVIVTNESMDRFKKPEAIAAAIRKKCGRLEGFARAAGVPLLVLCATAKDDFRKPGTGCWDYVARHAYPDTPVDKAGSFFVGDAAGRLGDHGDGDREFARAVGIAFFDEKAFFLERHPAGA